jgi:hypothetical protein
LTVDPAALGLVLFGLIQVALAAILFAFGMSNRANRTYALTTVILGLGGILEALPLLVNDAALADYLRRVAGYVQMAQPASLLYFALTYSNPRIRSLRGWRGALALTAGIVIPAALYAVHHDWFYGGPDAPLFLYRFYGFKAVVGTAAVLFVHAATHMEPSVARRSLILVSASVGGFGAFQGTSNAIAAFGAGRALDPSIDGPFDDLILCVLVAMATTGLFRILYEQTPAHERRLVRRSIGLIVFGFVTGTAGGWFFAAAGVRTVYALFFAFWVLTYPAVFAYCILRYQVFDLDIRFKASIDRGTLGGIYLAIFLFVSKLADRFVETTFAGQPWVVGALAAAVLLLALAPLHRLTQRLANRALPGVKPIADMSRDERSEFYRSQLLLALSDGGISHDERRMLEFARKRLGITDETARALERDAAAVA